MTYKRILVKLDYYSRQASAAWRNGNHTDYAINNALFELASKQLVKRDAGAAQLFAAQDMSHNYAQALTLTTYSDKSNVRSST